ncbi:MAG: hypothetical protein ACO1NW_06290 [Chitinophagaceae bacterium]
MYQLSCWASRHVWPARAILLLCWLVLNLLAVVTGLLISDVGFLLTKYFLLVGVVSCGLGVLLYRKHRTPKKNYYFKRKLADAMLALGTFLMVAGEFQKEQPFRYGGWVQPMSTQAAVVAPENGPFPTMKKAKQTLRQQLKVLQQYRMISRGGKIAVIAFILATGILAFIGVSALACEISCNGSEALAVVVFLLGTAAITIGVIALLRVVKRKFREKTVWLRRKKRSTFAMRND